MILSFIGCDLTVVTLLMMKTFFITKKYDKVEKDLLDEKQNHFTN